MDVKRTLCVIGVALVLRGGLWFLPEAWTVRALCVVPAWGAALWHGVVPGADLGFCVGEHAFAMTRACAAEGFVALLTAIVGVRRWRWLWAVWPTATAGTQRGSFADAAPAEQPKGYRWYKVAGDIQLKPDSVISFWPGSLLPLDGAVGDNSEIGQKYDIWVSLRIEGKDMFKDGKATADTVYFFDQAAVIRKTRHQVK